MRSEQIGQNKYGFAWTPNIGNTVVVYESQAAEGTMRVQFNRSFSTMHD